MYCEVHVATANSQPISVEAADVQPALKLSGLQEVKVWAQDTLKLPASLWDPQSGIVTLITGVCGDDPRTLQRQVNYTAGLICYLAGRR